MNRKMWVWGYEFRKKIINLCPSIVKTVTELHVHMPETLPKTANGDKDCLICILNRCQKMYYEKTRLSSVDSIEL